MRMKEKKARGNWKEIVWFKLVRKEAAKREDVIKGDKQEKKMKEIVRPGNRRKGNDAKKWEVKEK